MGFFAELKRRNVVRVAVAYVLMSWVLLQLADFALDLIGAPNWVIQAFTLAVAIGLPIALILAWAFELTPEGIKREAEVDRTTSITPQTGRKLDRLIIAVLVLVIVGMGGERWLRPASTPGSAADWPAPPVQARKSIAVLPFADMSQNQDQGWFADGLAEEILNALVKVPDLAVTSRTSSFQFKGQNQDISEIASQLGVDHVLEGSVRSGGDRIRITAQLIRADDGFHLWSQTYDRLVDDMIAIQEDLAASIALALETSLDPETLAEMAQAGTDSAEAYREYLRGLELYGRAWAGGGQSQSADFALQGYEHFENARAIDPRFASAHLRAAEFWRDQLTSTTTIRADWDSSPLERLAAYHERIDLAIRTADNEGDRVLALANRAIIDMRLNEALRLLTQYLEIRPNDTSARYDYVVTLGLLSRRDEAARALADWIEAGITDPTSAVNYADEAYRSIHPSLAADQALKFLVRWPNNAALIYQTHRTLMWAGRFDEARDLLQRYETLVPGGTTLMRARQACAEGDRPAAEAVVASIDRDRDDSPALLWILHNMLGNTKAETKVLRPLEQFGVPYQLGVFLNYPKFDPRPFPGLVAILEREGIERSPPAVPPFQCPPAAN